MTDRKVIHVNKTALKMLAERALALMLTVLLLIPGGSVFAVGNNTVNETEHPEDADLLESVEHLEGTESSENTGRLDITEPPEGLDPTEATGIAAKKVSLLTVDNITSHSENGTFSKNITVPLVPGGKSMWYNDFDYVKQVIRTYNDNSLRLTPDGTIDITVYMEGVGNPFTKINGYETGGISIKTVEDVFEENLQYSRTRYTIDAKSIAGTIAPYTIFTAGIVQDTNPGTSVPYTRHEVNVYIYWDRSDLPDPPSVSFVYDSTVDKMVLSGVDSTMEYRGKSGGSNSWEPCTDEPMYFDFEDTTDRYYYVRYSEAGTGTASQVQEVMLPGKPFAPSAVYYNSTPETFTGLSSAMEIRFGNGSYEPITATTLEVADVIDTIADGDTLTVSVRQKGTATRPSGLPKTFTLYPRAAVPTSVTFNPIPLTLTGCTSAMQYRADTQTAWTSAGTTVSLLNFASGDRDVIVYVRTKPTSKNAASKTVSFTIPKLLEGPAVTIEYDNERISGLEPGAYQYSLNGTSWTKLNITDGNWKLASLITTSPRTLYLRKAATSTAPITAPTVFSIPRRPVAPTTPKFVYNDANNPGKIVLSGVTTNMEYRKSTDTNWSDVPASGLMFDPQIKSVNYRVRNKATTDTWASDYKNVTTVAMPTAPTIYYDKNTETLSKLGTAYEISFNGGAYTSLTATTYNLSAQIDNIPPNGTLLVSVRRRATSSAPAGQIATFTVNARESAVADTREIGNGFEDVPEAENTPAILPEVENTPVIQPEAEGIPVMPPEIEDISASTPETEVIPEISPETDGALAISPET